MQVFTDGRKQEAQNMFRPHLKVWTWRCRAKVSVPLAGRAAAAAAAVWCAAVTPMTPVYQCASSQVYTVRNAQCMRRAAVTQRCCVVRMKSPMPCNCWRRLSRMKRCTLKLFSWQQSE